MSSRESGASSEPLVVVGTILGGKYRIERVIAEGGMGIVARAVNIDLGSKVAIKVLHPELREDEGAFARFLQEARGVAKLKSEHIVQMIDVSSQVREMPYMVMELLDGQDLDAMVQLRGALPYKTAADFIRQACAGVGIAHKAGILHRDLKPANLFLARKPDGGAVIKVLDFGLMKIKPERGEDVKITRPNDVFGSPSYMSPEQISAEVLDERTDVWSLGAILYELVTGHTAFGAETIAQTLVNISIHHPPPLSTFADVSPEFEAVVARCLAKDREERYATVDELANELAPFTGGQEASTLLPERTQSIAPPPPVTLKMDQGGSSEREPWSEGPIIHEATMRMSGEPPRRSLEPTLSIRTTGGPPSGKLNRTFVVAIIVGAAIGGLLAFFFIRSGASTDNTPPHPSAISTTSASPDTIAPPDPTPSSSADGFPHLNVSDLPSARPNATPPRNANSAQHPAPSVSANAVVVPVAPVTSAGAHPATQTPVAAPSIEYGEFGRRK